MKQYLDLCEHILENGNLRGDRTGTGTIGIFGYQMRYDLSKGFPLITTKDMSGVRFDGIVEELLWFLNGDTNIKYLVDRGINIWNRDAYRIYLNSSVPLKMNYEQFVERIKADNYFAAMWGNLGPIYGEQWRSWKDADGSTIDQISKVIESLKNDLDSRRHIVSAWNVGEVEKMGLPPCHVLFQFYVSEGKLSCQLYQRSGDVFLGIPYNIASYSLLTMMIADQVGLGYGEFIHTIGDAHIYSNHIEQVKLQLTREPKPLPKLHINLTESIFDYERKDFILADYDPYPSIKGEQSS